MREFTATIQALDPPIPWSQWTNFGFILGLERIRGEDIASYRDRLLDVMVHRAGPSHLGLAHGINRELGLTFTDGAIVITLVNGPDMQPITRDLKVSVVPGQIVFNSELFVVEDESHVVPSDTLVIPLDRQVGNSNLTVKDSDGELVTPDNYVVDPYRHRVSFTNTYAGQTLLIGYNYQLSVDIDDTIANIVTAIAVCLTANGEQFVTAIAKPEVLVESGVGIPLMRQTHVLGSFYEPDGDPYYDEIRLPWGQVYTRSLNDPIFIESKLGVDRSWLSTVLMSYVEEARNISHIEWSKTRFDYDRWSTNMGLSEVPFLFDARVTHWTCEDPQHTVEFTSEEYNALGGTCPIDGRSLIISGIYPSHMASGVGGSEDLKVIVEQEDPSYTYTAQSYTYYTVASAVLAVPSNEQTLISEGL